MTQVNTDVSPAVPTTEVKPWLTLETMSPLGRALMKIAEEIEASDVAETSEEDIEQELALRRGK